MEKDWPILEECPQYRYGVIAAALHRYPWEENGYEFDFESYYPPIPDEPPWFRKVVESTRDKVRPPFPEIPPEEDINCCPICTPPVRNMDPIPCPFHILDHFYHPLNDSGVVISHPSLVTPEQLQSTNKFLKEVRATRGYNVNSTPRPGLVTSDVFRQDDLDDIIFNCSKKTRREFLIELYLNPLIDRINFKTGKNYKLVNILKSVLATPLLLLTFSATASPAPEQTFIATMFDRPLSQLDDDGDHLAPPRSNSNPNILECLLLPDYDAPCKTQPWSEEDIRKESFSYIERRMAFYFGTAVTTKRPAVRKRETDMTLRGKDKDSMVEQLKKRKLELTAQLEEVQAKLVNLESRFQSDEQTDFYNH